MGIYSRQSMGYLFKKMTLSKGYSFRTLFMEFSFRTLYMGHLFRALFMGYPFGICSDHFLWGTFWNTWWGIHLGYCLWNFVWHCLMRMTPFHHIKPTTFPIPLIPRKDNRAKRWGGVHALTGYSALLAHFCSINTWSGCMHNRQEDLSVKLLMRN